MPIGQCFDNDEGRNAIRAGWAGAALAAFIDQTGCDEGIDSLHDLIADLGHLAEIEGYDFLGILERAIGTWSAERAEPDGLAPAPSVSITISDGGRA